ncbi:MAG: trimethylamine methyltransferase family protein, partial [Pseudomonadota bacterium]
GAEKALNAALALQAGAHLVTQAAGTQAALMAAAFESYVIDNDMLGALLRAAAPVEVTPETLAVQTIRDVVAGEGHFLGQPDTYRRMSTDFLYPDLFDRRAFEEWEEDGAPDLRETARLRAREILAEPPPSHVPAGTRRDLIARFGLIEPSG